MSSIKLGLDTDEEIKMWVGWNASFVTPHESPKHRIWYLPQINESPTSNAVVKETLQRSLTIAKECNKTSIAATYDLAIAIKAFRIQEQESPDYDNVFIALGPFHIQMSFFKAVGKYIAESGGPHMLIESHVLAEGSLNVFLNGKAFERCRRIHVLFAAAFESLHFEQFLEEQQDKEDLLLHLWSDQQQKATKERSTSNKTAFELSLETAEAFSRYERYCQDTSSGKHGKTAQFWYGYIDLIFLYRLLSRSLREGNFELYTHCMRLVTDVFFAFNHQNYSRWLVRYNDNLLKLNTTHPEVYQEFQQGNFAVRRTKKPFSGSPIDLTLEQTINANAASQTLGISHMTNSISARQRWALSHADRMTVITIVLQDLSITKKEDVTAELRKNRMTKDRLDLCNLRDNLRETMNPFDPTLDPDFLFYIASGKSASEDTAGFLLNCRKIGKKRHDQFITECIDKPSRFEEKITRQEVVTFEAASKKHKISSKDNSILSFKMMRDVFGTILHWALEKKILLTWDLSCNIH